MNINKVHRISGLREIYDNYDIFILDQWGVMHDGYKGYKHSVDCVNKLFENDKTLLIISNSSKRNEITLIRLPQLGFNSNFFNGIMTSGEMIWQSLANEKHLFTKNLGKNCYHIFDQNLKDAKGFLDGLNKFDFVDDLNEADFILGCTPFAGKKILDFVPILEIAKNKNLPFICANPDFETINKESKDLVFCMGTIAELYKNMGGNIFLLGKPNIEIYTEVLKPFSHINKSRILAIGDSLHHDIKGAKNFGIDSLLVTSKGIHKDLFDDDHLIWDNPKNILKNLQIEPTFICSNLIF